MTEKIHLSRLIQTLKRHEGFVSKPYQCPAGFLTIGYGRNLDAKGISDDEGEALLINDITEAEERVRACVLCYDQLSAERKEVLINMAFNLGLMGFLKFRKMLAAVESGDYDRAAKEMLDSKWARQVGNRAKELAATMRGANDPT